MDIGFVYLVLKQKDTQEIIEFVNNGESIRGQVRTKNELPAHYATVVLEEIIE
jgi:hypothetical protein